MSANRQSYPTVQVLRWDAQTVYLTCPYCERIHRHGSRLPGRRAAHCVSGGQYEFILPIDEETGLVGYEIDKMEACFVNVCKTSDSINEVATRASLDDVYDLSDHFREVINLSAPTPVAEPVMNWHEDSKEVRTIPVLGENVDIKMIHCAISDCVCGDVARISRYLQTTSEKNLFLHGRDRNGSTACILAAMETTHEMVSLLLQNGANVNAVNEQGRSALMEAALWGRTKNVEVLLDANADKYLVDHEGRSALDLARPSRRNQEERQCRLPKTAGSHQFGDDSDRKRITILIDDQSHEDRYVYKKPRSEAERNMYGYTKDPCTSMITMRGPISSTYVHDIRKTAAELDRGTQFPRITATSGWDDGAQPPNRTFARAWTEQVFYIASIVGHELEEAWRPELDCGTPGNFNACHAEKKLIAFFIDKHVFTPEDLNPSKELKGLLREAKCILKDEQEKSSNWTRVCDLEVKTKELFFQHWNAQDELRYDGIGNEEGVQRLEQQLDSAEKELKALELQNDVKLVRSAERVVRNAKARCEMHNGLIELNDNKPQLSLKEAVILTSNRICDDCRRFTDRVNSHFNLRIEIEWREDGR